MTIAPLVVHDKVIVGISGGEYGVRGYLTAYDLNTGKLAWRAYSVGPDEDILIRSRQNHRRRHPKPVGKDSSLKTWQGDEWKLGGGTTWGWYTYDPQLNLVYYGSGNPGTWNPSQRPGDNKWSTTLFARNPDTGVAAWAYQMTPHDAWDYDGINESVLTDSCRRRQDHPDPHAFRPQRLRLRAGPAQWQAAQGQQIRSVDELGQEIDLKTGRPVLNPDKMTKADVNVKDICPAARAPRITSPPPTIPTTKLFYVATNHICMDYQAFSVKYKGGFPYVGAILSMFPADHGDVRGRLIAFDPGHRRDQMVDQRHVPGLQRPADHRRRRTLLRNAGRMVQGRGSKRQARCCINSMRPRASSATPSPTCTKASSTSPC